MIDAQLGPPVAVASRGGSAPTGSAGGDNATATQAQADDGGFTAALESRTTPASSDARPAEAHKPKDAAGPQTGELQEEDAAEAGASQEQTVAADVAAVPSAIVSAVVPTAASPTPPSGALAGQLVVEVAQAAGPPQPIAGLVPALLDGKGGVMPAPAETPATPGQIAAPTPTVLAAQATVATAKDAAVAATAADPATGMTPAAASATSTPAPAAASGTPAATPAATLTLTITPVAARDAAAPAPELSGVVPAVIAPAKAPVGGAGIEAKPVAAPVPPVAEVVPTSAKTAPATTTDAPAGTVAPPPPAPPTHADPLGGIVRPGGGLTTPHELAREIGSRVHMAVREGGRELVVNLRPAELGHLTIRVTMADGVLQAHIIADRPEAARMLQQSLGQLDTALGDLGYSLDTLDIAYGGQDPRDAQSSPSQTPVVRGEVLEPDGSPAVSGTPTSAAAGSPARLDILA